MPALSIRLRLEPNAFTVWFRQIAERAGTWAVEAWGRGDPVSQPHMKTH
jgi:hypothetical protein